MKQAGAVKSESRDLVIRNNLASLQFARLSVDVPKGQTCVFLNQKDDNPATRSRSGEHLFAEGLFRKAEGVDGRVIVAFARSEDDVAEHGVVDGSGAALTFQAEAGVFGVGHAGFAEERAVEERRAVKLDAILRGERGHREPASSLSGLEHLKSRNSGFRFFQNRGVGFL